MKRFILGAGPDRENLVRLDGDDYHYLVQVRRLAVGERFPALLPDNGGNVTVRIVSTENQVLTGEVLPDETVPVSPRELPPIILMQSMLKGDKMDLIIRQAAEGALSQIVPFVSSYSVVKIKDNEGMKLSRWQRIIREARQQSGSTVATVIHQPVNLNGLFTYWGQLKSTWPGIVGLLFHQLPLANESLHRYLGRNEHTETPEAVALAIGPEGGFSPAEAQRFVAVGFKPFTIEDVILRSETAALYAQAAVRTLLAERDSWQTT